MPEILGSMPKRIRSRARCYAMALLLLVSPFPSAFATTVIPPSFAQLVAESDYVVHGKVTAVTSAWEQRGNSRVIVTKVNLDVIEVISGEPPRPLVLTTLGGKIGSRAMVIEGAPQFEVGDEDILFIQGNGRNISPIARIMYGRYRIESEGEGEERVVVRENGEPLRSTSEISAPMHEGEHDHHDHDDSTGEAAALPPSPPLSPTEFINRIRSVAASTSAEK
ncbi:MAG: hypothetical protein SynsKO_05270 [Synoicihabitans sp.]